MSSETYLGDGLYVSHDGWQFRLRAPRADGDHVVYMEPSVVDAFRQYVDHFYARVRAAENCDCDESE